MKDLIRKTKYKTGIYWHILRDHFPRIVAYTLASFVIITLLQFAYYRFLPGTYFINYTSAVVSNAREAENVPFTVCQQSRGNYQFEGFHDIYLLPEGKSDEHRVLVKSIATSGAINPKEPCRNYQITPQEYSHKAGRYVLHGQLDFRLPHNVIRTASFTSNVYTIEPRTSDQNRQLIEDLQDRVNQLQDSINAFRALQGLDPIPFKPVPSQEPINNNTNGQPQNVGNSNGNSSTNPSPNNQPDDSYLGCVGSANGILPTLGHIITCL